MKINISKDISYVILWFSLVNPLRDPLVNPLGEPLVNPFGELSQMTLMRTKTYHDT